MRTNTTKAKLGEGDVVFGAIISRYAPDLVELFGAQLRSQVPKPPLPENVLEMWAILELLPPGRPMLLPTAWVTIH